MYIRAGVYVYTCGRLCIYVRKSGCWNGFYGVARVARRGA